METKKGLIFVLKLNEKKIKRLKIFFIFKRENKKLSLQKKRKINLKNINLIWERYIEQCWNVEDNKRQIYQSCFLFSFSFPASPFF